MFSKSRAVWKLTREPLLELEHGKLPAPVAEASRLALKELEKTQERLKRLESLSGLLVSEGEMGTEGGKL